MVVMSVWASDYECDCNGYIGTGTCVLLRWLCRHLNVCVVVMVVWALERTSFSDFMGPKTCVRL